MDFLNVLTSYALVALCITAAWAPFLINMLYKLNLVVQHRLMRNKMNEEFIKIHGHKTGTPNMGGLMISITVGVMAMLLLPGGALRNVFLVGWGIFTLYGVVEGFLVFGKKIGDEKFRLLQESFGWRIGKLALLYFLVFAALHLAVTQLGITELTIWGDSKLTINLFTELILAFAGVLAMYGMEVTDGADGLVTGQFLVAFGVYASIAVVTIHYELLPYIGALIGSSLIYLYFNINPARVFMGETGTLPIAFALMYFALITDTLIPFAIMGLLFWVELFSSMSQILAIKFFKRKIFRIAPIHHHFEAIGWSEAKVVQRFWLFSALAGLVALWVVGLM